VYDIFFLHIKMKISINIAQLALGSSAVHHFRLLQDLTVTRRSHAIFMTIKLWAAVFIDWNTIDGIVKLMINFVMMSFFHT